MISLLAKSLVFAGTLILARALVIVRQLIGSLPSGPLRSRWYTMTALIALFLVGYVAYIGAFWNRHSGLFDLIVPGIFFFGGCFVWLAVVLSLQTTMDVLRVSELERETFTDSLTGLFNRRYLKRRLGEEVATARRYGLPLAILLLDIDYFKQVNDRYGHQVGDQVLVSMGKVVLKELRESDVLVRYGGEEFIVIAPHTSLLPARDLAERLRERIEGQNFNLHLEPCAISEISLTVSIGVASFDDEIDSLDKLIQAADKNLYRAKHEGRNQVVASGWKTRNQLMSKMR